MTSPWFRNVSLALIAFGAAPGAALADKILLRGGGQIKGKVIPDPKRPDRVGVLTERGKTPLTFDKAKILEVVKEPSALDEYLGRRDRTSLTAEAQHELGLWCERNKLPDLAALHFEAAAKADDHFEPAHRKLGHVFYADRWLSGDKLREAQGLVLHKGKWVTPDEKGVREKASALSAEQAAWVKKIRALREALVFGDDGRRREAQARLLAIAQPSAVVPLMRVLADDAPAVRSVLARALGAVPGREASSALVSRLLAEEEPEVRLSTFEEVARRDDDAPLKGLTRALRSADDAVINRAAWALARLNAVASVPSLVGSLVVARERMVITPPGSDPPGAADPAPSMGVTFGSYGSSYGTSGGYGLIPPNASPAGALAGYNGSSAVYVNGAVGPGVAALGATSVPVYPINSGLPPDLASLTGGQPSGLNPALPASGLVSPRAGGGGRDMPKIVQYTVQNVEVHDALVKLTGQDFGYDVAAWKRWLKTSFRPDPAPARKVPQP